MCISPGQSALPGEVPINYCSTFIGNSVLGNRFGVGSFYNNSLTFSVTFSGNSLTLSPPFDYIYDYPGAALGLQSCQKANILGNTLVSGGHGVLFDFNCASALIMNNDFSKVAYRGIGYTSDVASLQNASIFGNALGQGVSFHAQFNITNSFGWFFNHNQFLNGSASAMPFMSPASSASHVSN
jgi:hypothetical protein